MTNAPPKFTADQLIRFAEAVVAPLGTPMVVTDERLRIVAASEPFRQMLADRTDPCGQELLSLEQARWDVPELRRALENVLPQERAFDDVEVPGPGGTALHVGARALHADPGLPVLILLSFAPRPSGERTDLLEEEELTREIVATVREPLLVLDYDHRVKMANQSFYREFRVSPDEVLSQPLRTLGNGQWDIPELRHQLEVVLSHDRSFNDFEVDHDFEEIGRRTMLLNARRIDHLRLILLAIEDVTDRRGLERHQETLISELAHRIRNLLAVVQSLALQTRGASVDEYRSVLLGRLNSLSAAHSVLFESRWRQAKLDDLLRQLLTPYIDRAPDRARLEGPAVSLSVDQTTALALLIHELATNAAKYGALSTSEGEVSVTWEESSGNVLFEWRETGGPPVPPKGSGSFGTTLIKRMASYQLGGRANLDFAPTGLVFRLEFPRQPEGPADPPT